MAQALNLEGVVGGGRGHKQQHKPRFNGENGKVHFSFFLWVYIYLLRSIFWFFLIIIGGGEQVFMGMWNSELLVSCAGSPVSRVRSNNNNNNHYGYGYSHHQKRNNLKPQQQPQVVVNHEIQLPLEWTYWNERMMNVVMASLVFLLLLFFGFGGMGVVFTFYIFLGLGKWVTVFSFYFILYSTGWIAISLYKGRRN